MWGKRLAHPRRAIRGREDTAPLFCFPSGGRVTERDDEVGYRIWRKHDLIAASIQLEFARAPAEAAVEPLLQLHDINGGQVLGTCGCPGRPCSPIGSGHGLELARRFHIAEPETCRRPQVHRRDVMLGIARQPRSRRVGPSESVSEPVEHVAESGQARHHRRLCELACRRRLCRGDKWRLVLGCLGGGCVRLGPAQEVDRVGGSAAARGPHRCPGVCLPKRDHGHVAVRGACRWSSRCCWQSGALLGWPPPRSRCTRVTGRLRGPGRRLGPLP